MRMIFEAFRRDKSVTLKVGNGSSPESLQKAKQMIDQLIDVA